MSDTPAPYITLPPARATAQPNAVLYPAGPWTERMQSQLQRLELDGFGMKKRALAAEARVQELLAELADAAEALDEAGHELEYERQMRQQTEEAMMKLGRRVIEMQADVDDLNKQVGAAHSNTSKWIEECGKRTIGRKQAEQELADFKESIRAELKEAYGQGEWANIHFMIEVLKPERPNTPDADV